MNRNHFLIIGLVFAATFFLFGSITNAGSEFTNNCGQAAQGLKLHFGGSHTVTADSIRGSIYPFTIKTAWGGDSKGVWLHGGTLENGGITQCFTYPTVDLIDSAFWTANDTNTVLGNALAGESICSVPSLTEWGIIILVALMIGSAIFILLKRRKATVPA
jgi:hypothetical protein